MGDVRFGKNPNEMDNLIDVGLGYKVRNGYEDQLKYLSQQLMGIPKVHKE